MKKEPMFLYRICGNISEHDDRKMIEIPVDTELWRYIFLLDRNSIEYEVKLYRYGISIETKYCIAIYNLSDGNFSRYSYRMK